MIRIYSAPCTQYFSLMCFCSCCCVVVGCGGATAVVAAAAVAQVISITTEAADQKLTFDNNYRVFQTLSDITRMLMFTGVQ